jgi:lipopolysaccharide export LptBFGC system permease protein LptF
MKSLGYSPMSLALPSIFFYAVNSVISAQTLFTLGPIAKLHSDELVNTIGSQQAVSSIEAGTFSESFFDLVFYSNQVDKENQTLHDLFIYDRRNPHNPVAIVAKKGRVAIDRDITSQTASILLSDGDIYKLNSNSHTKVQFETYELQISSPTTKKLLEKDPDTYTLGELRGLIRSPGIQREQLLKYQSEYQGRWALAASCLLFGFLGSALGSRAHRRSSASSGFVLTIFCIIFYWICYVGANTLAGKMVVHPNIALWAPNFLFLLVTLWAWRSHAKT